MTKRLISLFTMLFFLVACTPTTLSKPASPTPHTEASATITPSLSQAYPVSPEPSQLPAQVLPADFNLDMFPLFPGTSWIYSYTGYSQSPSDPNEILNGTLEIRETVSEVQSYPTFILAHILGSRSLLEADPGWQEPATAKLGNYEYFYVLKDGNVYRSSVYPELDDIQTGQMQQEFQFPMATGAAWCPRTQNEIISLLLQQPLIPALLPVSGSSKEKTLIRPRREASSVATR